MASLQSMADDEADQVCLRPMIAADLASVLALRNHPEIRRYMITQHTISLQEHTAWFAAASQQLGIELMVLEINGACRGFVQFKRSNFAGVVDWGFYVAPDAPKGTGKKLGLAALGHAFRKDNLYKVCGQALHWNQPSIDFHKSLGFAQEGVLRDQHFDGAAYHDLICFGLLKWEWATDESLTGATK